MVASNGGVRWAGEASADRMSFGWARNMAAELLVDTFHKAEGIMWVDSDMRPKPPQILELLTVASERGYDFLSGVYHQRRHPYKPCFFAWDDGVNGYRQNFIYQDNEVMEASACGFGFVWTSRKLVESIADLPGFSRDDGGWFPERGTSEDLGFCTLARRAGFKLFVHSGIQVDHLGDPAVISKRSFIEALGGHAQVEVVD